jgi:hypothetical protein
MKQVRFIAGSGRSGTTWIQDALAAANGLRPVFEPLNPFASRIGHQYAHRTLRSEADHEDLKTFLEEVFGGRSERLWTQYRRQRKWLVPTRDTLGSTASASRLGRRWLKFLRELPGLAAMTRADEPLVKCIYANLMLDWLRVHCHCRLLFVVRHPCAVIESELRSGWDPAPALERYRTDSELRASTDGRYVKLLSRQLTPVEALAAKWVVENQPVIEGSLSGGATVVFYEKLAAPDSVEWSRVLDAFGLARAPDARHLAQPSQQSAPRGSRGTIGLDRGGAWAGALDRGQVREIQGILDGVGFRTYSVRTGGPQPDAASSVHRSTVNLP